MKNGLVERESEKMRRILNAATIIVDVVFVVFILLSLSLFVQNVCHRIINKRYMTLWVAYAMCNRLLDNNGSHSVLQLIFFFVWIFLNDSLTEWMILVLSLTFSIQTNVFVYKQMNVFEIRINQIVINLKCPFEKNGNCCISFTSSNAYWPIKYIPFH